MYLISTIGSIRNSLWSKVIHVFLCFSRWTWSRWVVLRRFFGLFCASLTCIVFFLWAGFFVCFVGASWSDCRGFFPVVALLFSAAGTVQLWVTCLLSMWVDDDGNVDSHGSTVVVRIVAPEHSFILDRIVIFVVYGWLRASWFWSSSWSALFIAVLWDRLAALYNMGFAQNH